MYHAIVGLRIAYIKERAKLAKRYPVSSGVIALSKLEPDIEPETRTSAVRTGVYLFWNACLPVLGLWKLAELGGYLFHRL